MALRLVLEELLASPEELDHLDRDGALSLLPLIDEQVGRLHRLRTDLLLLLLKQKSPVGSAQAPDPAEDRFLNCEQAAAFMNVSRQWLRVHGRKMPFTVKLSQRTVRYSEARIRAFMSGELTI